MSFLEMAMLIGFGVSWPFSIYRSYKKKSVKGKSIIFLFCILIGYFAGILHKFLYSYDWVLFFYLLNFSMVFTDIVLYFKYENNG